MEVFKPISLTPVLSKILEHFISRWLLQVIEPYIDILQFGNTRNCSTTHALIHLIHNWLAALDSPQGKSIRACMTDFSKAFDRIDHNNLYFSWNFKYLASLPSCSTGVQISYMYASSVSKWVRLNHHGIKLMIQSLRVPNWGQYSS